MARPPIDPAGSGTIPVTELGATRLGVLDGYARRRGTSQAAALRRLIDLGLAAAEHVDAEQDRADSETRARVLAVEEQWVQTHGAAPTLADYRARYAEVGVEWPGDDVIRSRHLIGDDDGNVHAPDDPREPSTPGT